MVRRSSDSHKTGCSCTQSSCSQDHNADTEPPILGCSTLANQHQRPQPIRIELTLGERFALRKFARREVRIYRERILCRVIRWPFARVDPKPSHQCHRAGGYSKAKTRVLREPFQGHEFCLQWCPCLCESGCSHYKM